MRLAGIICAAAVIGAPAFGQSRNAPHELIVHWSDMHQSTEYTRIYPNKDECERARSAVIAEQHRKLIFEERSSSSAPRGTVVIVPGTAPYTVCIPLP